MYEFLHGSPPFEDKNRQSKRFSFLCSFAFNFSNGDFEGSMRRIARVEFKYPGTFTEDAKDLIGKVGTFFGISFCPSDCARSCSGSNHRNAFLSLRL